MDKVITSTPENVHQLAARGDIQALIETIMGDSIPRASNGRKWPSYLCPTDHGQYVRFCENVYALYDRYNERMTIPDACKRFDAVIDELALIMQTTPQIVEFWLNTDPSAETAVTPRMITRVEGMLASDKRCFDE